MPSREAGKKLSKIYCTWKDQHASRDIYPIGVAMEHISNKWSTHIIINLSEFPLRFGELKRAIPDISQRVLAQTLRDLERDGLVNRVVYPTNPPSVEYSLTILGQSLLVPLWYLADWANSNYQVVLGSRERFKRTKK